MSINSDVPARAEHLAFTSAAITTMGACPVWDAAMTKYLAAMTLCQAEMQYGATGKAEDADGLDRLLLKEQHGKKWTALPDEITAPFQEAEDARSEAWTANFAQPQWDAATALVGTPAPTLAAAVFKDALIQREETPQWPNLPFDCMAVLSADFARLTCDQTGAAWAAVWQSWEAAKAAEDTYHREVWQPALEAEQNGGAKMGAHISAEIDRLANARMAEDAAIIATPAPDLGKAVWKLDYAREEYAGCVEIPSDWWNAIMADLRRLGGEA